MTLRAWGLGVTFGGIMLGREGCGHERVLWACYGWFKAPPL